MKNKTVKVLCILVVILAVAYFLVSIVMNNIESNLEDMADMPVVEVDLTNMEDGTYSGSHSAFPLSAEVEVVLENHAITDIELVRHRHSQGAAAEVIPGRVVEAQTLEVDSVTGATYSSKVILKAIENALMSAGE